jgi:hypothetical protein
MGTDRDGRAEAAARRGPSAAVRIARVTLELDPPAQELRPQHLRAAVAALAPAADRLHQHTEAGLAYRYPLAHYRCHGGRQEIVGFNEGAEDVLALPLAGAELRLGRGRHRVAACEALLSREELRLGEDWLHYRLSTPALLLNQKNFEVYRRLGGQERSAMLDRLCVAHLLRLAKGLGCWLEGRVVATLALAEEAQCRYKDRSFLGLTGELVTNLRLPSHVAIGHAVSHGFGVIEGA